MESQWTFTVYTVLVAWRRVAATLSVAFQPFRFVPCSASPSCPINPLNESVAPVSKVSKTGSKEKEDISFFFLSFSSQHNFNV